VLEDRLAPALLMVSNTLDSGPGSLRQAILDADNNPGQMSAIDFALAGSGLGVQTIAVQSPLPAITTPLALDGTSQPGFAGSPLIDLSGQVAGAGANGLVVTAGGSTIRGLAINGFSGAAVYLAFGGGNVLDRDYLGTDASGTNASGNGFGVVVDRSNNNVVSGCVLSGNAAYGVILGSASGNEILTDLIGTNASGSAPLANAYAGVVLSNAAGNLIAGDIVGGNGAFGVELSGAGASGNLVLGNNIGLSGGALGNGVAGVLVGGGASNTTIGGTGAGQGNVVSGNGGVGVWLDGSGPGNTVVDNMIGTNAAGTVANGNALDGVQIAFTSGNMVSGNTISGSGRVGVLVGGAGTTGNVLAGNRIGTNSAGTAALANALGGVFMQVNATGNTVGGTMSSSGNVISDNGQAGVTLVGAGVTGNLIEGNTIGAALGGSVALANGGDGVLISGGASNNTIGGTASGAGNIVSGNGNNGVEVGGSGNLIEGNQIGTNAAGSAALANAGDGVAFAAGANNNTIGGTATGAGNLISGNKKNGLEIAGSGNLVEGNQIGTNAAGTAALANGQDGVLLDNGANGNTLGGTASGAGNVISGNDFNGVEIAGSGNLVEGNQIGTNAAGTAALANGAHGMFIAVSGSGNTIGGTASGAGNLISFNGQGGIEIDGSGNLVEDDQISGNGIYGVTILGSNGNLIQGNDIGTLADGITPLANGNDGVFIASGNPFFVANNNTVSTNTIAFNKGDGVLVGSDAFFPSLAGTGNKVTQNSIFSNTQIGIDLGRDDGVTANDSAGHTGPNNFQDFPSITSAVSSGGTTTVNYTVTQTANVSYTVEFFVSPTADPSGFGQGKTFVGSQVVSSTTGGLVTNAVVLTGDFTGQFVTATATDASGNTSEFSNAVQVLSAPP
jgi:titin